MSAFELEKGRKSCAINDSFSARYDLKDIDEDDSDATADLDPEIRRKMELELDDHNRFNILLAVHPSKVKPAIYLSLYHTLTEQPEQELVAVLLRRLLFHRDFSSCWEIMLMNFPTLTDLEEIIEVILAELDANSDKVFGIFDLIIAGKASISSFKMFTTVIEIMKHKEKVLVEECLRVINSLSEQDLLRYPNPADSVYYQMSYCRSLQHSRLPPLERTAVLMNLLRGNMAKSPVISTPGWLRSLIVVFPDLAIQVENEGVLYESYCKLNAFDIAAVVKNGTRLSNPLRFLIAYEPTLVRNLTYERHALNGLIRECTPHVCCGKEVGLILQLYHILDSSVSSELIDHIVSKNINVETFIESVKSLSENHFLDFTEELINSAIKSNNLTQISTFLSEIEPPFLVNRLINFLTTSLRQIMLEKLELRAFIHELAQACATCKAQMQLLRESILHYKIDDDQLLSSLVERSFSTIWNLTIDDSSKKLVSFQELYISSSRAQRQILHNHIRALAQLLSVLPRNDMLKLLNVLQVANYPFTDKKNYILSKTMKEFIRFLVRSETSGIDDVDSILQSLSLKPSLLDALRYQFMIGKDPKFAIELLNQNAERKSWMTGHVLSSISISILESKVLGPRDRLKLFQSFRIRMKELDYKNKLRSTETIKLVDLILALADRDPSLEFDRRGLMDVILSINGLPEKIKKNWKSRIRLLSNINSKH